MKNDKKNKRDEKAAAPDVQTPTPPQDMNPNERSGNQEKHVNPGISSDKKSKEKEKLLNEDADIDDETTI